MGEDPEVARRTVVRVDEEVEGDVEFRGQRRRVRSWLRADEHRLDATRGKLAVLGRHLANLRHAQWTPVATIEHHEQRARNIAHADRVPVAVFERESG